MFAELEVISHSPGASRALESVWLSVPPTPRGKYGLSRQQRLLANTIVALSGCVVLSFSFRRGVLVFLFAPMVLVVMLLLLQANSVRQDPGPAAVSGRLPDHINIPHSRADERLLATAVSAEAHQKCRGSRSECPDDDDRNCRQE